MFLDLTECLEVFVSIVSTSFALCFLIGFSVWAVFYVVSALGDSITE